MQRGINNWKGILAALLLGLAPLCVDAQSSSLNTFSPYTFYGLGDLNVQGPTFLRSMGGIGVAYSNPRRSNFINPASYSQANSRSALFNVALEGGGVYSQTDNSSTSYNFGNISEVSLQLPLAKGWGFGVTVNPYSSVGYCVEMYETDPEILANVGSVMYSYIGDGNITQVKTGVGGELFKNFSAGVNMIYYHGQIGRDYATLAQSLLGNTEVAQFYGVTKMDFSRVVFEAGFQYRVINEQKRRLTVAAVYRPKFDMRPKEETTIFTYNVYSDSVVYSLTNGSYINPGQVTAGFYYQNNKVDFGVDYEYQAWGGLNDSELADGVGYKDTHSIKAGVQYIPNVYDPRKYARRIAYRLGFRYSTYYLTFDGRPIDDRAITMGVGFPIGRGLNNIDVGLEAGRRGDTYTGGSGATAYALTRERYVKLSVGLSLFGEDYWFSRPKYE